MSVTYIAGAQNTGNILQDERGIDIPNEIFWLEKDATPLLHLSAGKDGNGLPAKKRKAINPEFTVLEKQPHGAWTAINAVGGYTAGDTTFICDDVTMVNVWDKLKIVSTEEVVLVLSKSNASNTVIVQRGFGGTSAAIIADNDPLYLIGSGNEEFGALPPVLMVKNRKRVNYCGIERKAFGLSNTAKNSEYYGGSKYSELSTEGVLEWKKKTERDFWFSEPYEDLTGGPTGNPIRATGGAYYWIKNGGGYTMSATTTFTKTDWVTFSRNSFLYGSDTKVVVCSPLVIDMLDSWKDGNLQFKPSDHVYDMTVAVWETGHGTLLIKRNKMFENSPYGTTTVGYGGMAIVLDPANLEYRYLQNRDMALHLNVKRDGADGFYDEVKGEVGLGLQNPETMSIVEDITTYA